MQGKPTRPGLYKCKDCGKPFTITVGTVMVRSHVPLHKWVWAAQLMASSKKGFCAHELHRLIGTNYETAWFLFIEAADIDLISLHDLAIPAKGRRAWVGRAAGSCNAANRLGRSQGLRSRPVPAPV
jgi:hypothetical protein